MLVIREFEADRDYQVVFELWKTAGLLIRPSDTLDEVRKKLERDRDLFLVAEEDGAVVGAVMGGWDGRRGWVYHLAVDRARQRNGIGRQLMAELERRLRAKGALKINLQVYRDNVAAQEFYQKLGYSLACEILSMGKELTDNDA
ncbi:MAG: GNAT family acetyltransferase [Chloroflexota bacterium]